MEAARVWRSADGRIRLGFRLLLFLAFLAAVVIVTAPFSPRVLPWSAVPTLLGTLLAGWGLLSLEVAPLRRWASDWTEVQCAAWSWGRP